MELPFIHRRGDHLARTARGQAATYLLAQRENLEVSRHDLPPETPVKVSPLEQPADGEVFYLLSGRLHYRDEDVDVALEPGDCVAAHEMSDSAYFETTEATTLLQITSLPSFSHTAETNRRFYQMAEQVEADEHMEGHSKRLEHMAIQLGHRLGTSGEAMYHLRSAAYFHDIGKAKVPQHLIQKPISLTDEEWAVMKRHSEWGRELLAEEPDFAEIGRIVEQIHERVDGGGYPHGLSGDEIRLEAKIVAVVDAYDAMTSDRPYRKGMPHDDALEELQANAGTQFAPDVVAAFVAEFGDRPPTEAPTTAEADLARWSQTESFLELGERILAGQDLDEILANVVAAITEHTPFQRAALALYDRPISPDTIEQVRIAHTAQSGLTPEEEAQLQANPLPPAERKKIFRDEFQLSRSYYIPADRHPWEQRAGFVRGQMENAEGNWHPEDMLFVPMWLPEDCLIGLISVDDPSDGRAPTPKGIEPLELFGNLTALAIQKTQNIHALQDHQRRLRGIHQLSEQLTEITHLNDLLERMNRVLLETFDYDIAGFVFVEGHELVRPVIDTRLPHTELAIDGDTRMPLDHGLLGWVAQHWTSALVGNVDADPRYVAIHPDIRSELAAPVIVDGALFGMLNIESTQAHAFTDEDRQLLEMLARQLAVAIANLRQQRQLQENVDALRDYQRRLQGIYQLSESLENVAGIDELVGQALDILTRHFDYHFAAFLWQEGDFLVPRKHATTLPREEFTFNLDRNRVPLDEGVVGWVARHGEPALIEDAQTISHHVPIHPELRSELAVPVIVEEQVIGVLNIENCQPHAFSAPDRDLLQVLARQLGVAFANVWRREEQAWTNRFLQRLNAAEDLDALLYEVLEQATAYLAPKADAGSVLLYNDATERFEFRLAANRDWERLRQNTYGNEELRRVLDVTEPTILTRSEQRSSPVMRRPAEESGVRIPGSTLVIPIRDPEHGELLAFLNLNNLKEEGVFTKADAKALEPLIPEITAALTRARDRERLEQQATRDPLTGVYNRHYFAEYVATEMARARRHGHPISLLMIDFDRFHKINDRLGHLKGDHVLREAAYLFQRHVRNADTVVRYGGDEFLILMPEIDRNGAERVAARLRRQLAHTDLGLLEEVTVSVGISTWSPEDDRHFEAVLEEADRWMYRRKRGERDDTN